MDDILAKKNRHLFLEEKDNQNNSFIGNINDVANRKTELDTVAAHIENVDTVGDHIDNVDTVANNISDINDAVDNIATVKTFNDNVNNGTMQYLLEAFTASLDEQGNAWEVRLTQLGESILATTSAFNYSTVVTVSSDIPANGTLTLPNSMKYKVGTHMLMVSWNGTVCYAGEQYDEIGAYGVWSTSITLKQPAKAGDKIQLRIVALTDQSSYVDITEAAVTASQFIASGANTERYLSEYFGDVVNVKNFGAVGNGVNDDTTAFQSAIASGKAVFVPEGTYKLNTDLNGVFCGVGNSIFTGGTVNGSTILRGVAQKNSDIINVKDFGAKGDGVTDDTVAVQAAITAGASTGKPLVFEDGKTYKLTGSSLTFTSGADFRGATLDVSGVAGPVAFNSPGDGWVEDALALEAIQAGSDLQNGASKVSGWASFYDVSEHYVEILSSQYFYTYRGDDITRYEKNFVTDRGHLLSPIKYGIDVDDITSVKKMKFNKTTTYYKNVVVKLGNRQPNNASWNGVVHVESSSNVRLENISFDVTHGAEFPSDNGFSLLSIGNSGHVFVDGLYFTSPIHKQDKSASYCLGIGGSYEVTIKNAVGQGCGWGAVGNNNSWRVSFINCDLSRVDFHQPFFEFLKLKDCRIGRSGLTLTSVGDLFVEDTTFMLEDSNIDESAASAVINSRGEANGICDGIAVLSRCKIIANTSNETIHLFKHGAVSEDSLKSGSPLSKVFWHNIKVDDIRFYGTNVVNLSPYVASCKGPDFIEYKNVSGKSCWSNNFIEGESPSNHDTSNIQRIVSIKNAPNFQEFKHIANISTPYLGAWKFTLEGLHKLDSPGFPFVVRGHVDISVIDSDLVSIYSATYNTNKNRISFDGCRIDTTNISKPFGFRSQSEKVVFKNCFFINQPTVEMFTQTITGVVNSEDSYSGLLGHIHFHDNWVYNKASGIYLDAIVVYEYSGSPSTNVEITLPTGFYDQPQGKKLIIILGGSGEYYTVSCEIPSHNTNNRYYLDGSKYIDVGKIYGTEKITISATSSNPVRRVLLGI